MISRGKLGAAFAAALVLAACVLLRSSDPLVLSALRGAGFDTLQRLWPRDASTPQPVRIIDIDEASLAELGQWPWPRNVMAKLTEEAFELGAAAIAFDIVFAEADRLSPSRIAENATSEDYDASFAAALSGRPVVLAMASSGATPPENAPIKAGFAQTGLDATKAPPALLGVTAPLAPLSAAAAGVGSISIDLAREQGVARQIPMLLTTGERLVPALVPETLRVAQGVDTLLVHASADTDNAITSLGVGEFEMPLSERGEIYVYYRPHDPSQYVSARKLVAGNARETLRPLIEGHIVYVGTSAVGLLDIRTTALGETVPGVAVHAQATEQVLSGQFLTRPEWVVGAEYVFVLLAGLGLALFGALARPLRTIAAWGLATVATLFAVAASFKGAGLLVDATFPILTLLLTAASVVAFRLLVTDREGRQLRQAFGQYVAPAVLAEIEQNPQSLKLGGEMRDVTVMFVDIVNFTPLSEKLPPRELVTVVNRLLDTVSQEILAERGTIDKYIGDAVMAFWNAPVPLPDHQYHAARAALRIRGAIAGLNATPEMAELPHRYGLPPLGVRIGMASGEACVGNMGSTDRFDYSVLGQTVNIAARAESSGKHMGHDIVLAGPLLGRSQGLAWLDGGRIAMKGKSDAQAVHALAGDEEMAQSAAFSALQVALAKLRRKPSKASVKTLARANPTMAGFISALSSRARDYR